MVMALRFSIPETNHDSPQDYGGGDNGVNLYVYLNSPIHINGEDSCGYIDEHFCIFRFILRRFQVIKAIKINIAKHRG